ncbi:hypothetical protein [Corynebacterium propinquum]
MIGLNSDISRPLSGIRDKDGETFQCNIIVEQYVLFICTKIRVAFIPQPYSSAPRLQLPITAILFADDTATSSTKRETELLDVLAKTGFPLNLEFQIFDGRLSGKYEDHVWFNSEKARTSSLVMSREGQQDKKHLLAFSYIGRFLGLSDKMGRGRFLEPHEQFGVAIRLLGSRLHVDTLACISGVVN